MNTLTARLQVYGLLLVMLFTPVANAAFAMPCNMSAVEIAEESLHQDMADSHQVDCEAAEAMTDSSCVDSMAEVTACSDGLCLSAQCGSTTALLSAWDSELNHPHNDVVVSLHFPPVLLQTYSLYRPPKN